VIKPSAYRVNSVAAAALSLTLCVSAGAQETAKIHRIGFISASAPSAVSARVEAFRQGLRELGYVEGKSILIEYRYAGGTLDRLPELLAELIRLKTDVIVSAGGQVTHAAKEASATTPIVMLQDPDPIASGFVASLARPGGNITGLSTLSPEISGKQVELLKEIMPRLSRVTVLGNSTNPGNAQSLRDAQVAAAALRVPLQYVDVVTPKDIETAFRNAIKGRADAVCVLPSNVAISQRRQIVDLAITNRLPAIYPRPEIVEDGGLMSYGVSANDLFRRGATYVDKILKGAKPADLPVEQPTKFEFIINLKAAKQIGLTIPSSVLARADRVIR
jgi:putative ABC transport system substrate-binding protein